MSQQEICRHFLRGSCRFGARCRYSHAIPNQSQNQTKPNPFGFGSSQFSQQQQQKPNPFGFGVQNRNSTAQFQSPSKPFDDKWTRQTSAGSEQADPQSQASMHTCTDPESCKLIVAEDFDNEAPQWIITCCAHYKQCAHYKRLPCDVHGDISPDELRAAAYEEAKQGRSLQSIVERERNLLQSELSKFENLLRNSQMNPTPPSTTTPTFTSYNQLGAASNSSSPERVLSYPNTPLRSLSSHLRVSTGSSNTRLKKQQQPQQQQPQRLSCLDFGFSRASPPPEEMQEEDTSDDDSIWLKEKWSIGEIPKRPPPLRFCV